MPLSFTVTTPSSSKVYDGTPLTMAYAAAPTLSGNVPPGATAVCTGSQTNAGSSPNTYRINWNGNNPANYKITENLGTLTVTPCPISVGTDGASKPYDGTPLRNPEGWVEGYPPDPITVTGTGSQTEIGSSQNTIQINWNGANPGNYTVYYQPGTLTVY